MANNSQQQNLNTRDLAQIATVAAAQTGAPTPELSALIALLTKKLSAEISEEEQKLAQARAAQLANANTLAEAQKVQENIQANCTHTKPGTNRTALAGQKTHRGHAVFVCQYCWKPFSDPPQRPQEKIPQHLYPDMSLVGGPH